MKFTKSIETSDLKLFATLEDAQRHELALLFMPSTHEGGYTVEEIATDVLNNREKILDILTTTERSRPAARKINGAVRKRRSARVITESETAA